MRSECFALWSRLHIERVSDFVVLICFPREQPERPPSAPAAPSHAKTGEHPPEDMFHKERPRPPKFKTPMKPLTRLMENDPAHFECRLVPVGDPDMVVEWYKDGVLLKHGQHLINSLICSFSCALSHLFVRSCNLVNCRCLASMSVIQSEKLRKLLLICLPYSFIAGHRFRPMYDFGFVALDILYTFPEDTGVYMCKATNKYGSDVNQVQLRCLGMFTLMLMLMYSIYPRANLVTKSYDGCAMRVVFSKLQNCADFNDGDFRDSGSAFQHMGTETAKAREPYVTVLVR